MTAPVPTGARPTGSWEQLMHTIIIIGPEHLVQILNYNEPSPASVIGPEHLVQILKLIIMNHHVCFKVTTTQECQAES